MRMIGGMKLSLWCKDGVVTRSMVAYPMDEEDCEGK
jgi:hypothetical protein